MVKFSTLIAVIALVCASILPSGSAHFECYNASGCGSPINHVATVSSIRDCCLGRRYDGLYYSNDGGPCTECIGKSTLIAAFEHQLGTTSGY